MQVCLGAGDRAGDAASAADVGWGGCCWGGGGGAE